MGRPCGKGIQACPCPRLLNSAGPGGTKEDSKDNGDFKRPLRFGFLNFEEKGLQMIDGLFQPTHLAILLAIALLIFGGRRLPELGQGLGKGIRGFKDGLRGIDEVEQTGAKTKAQN